MSGSFASIVTGSLGLALEAENARSGPPLSLGGFVFDRFEVPEQVTWGGAQRMNVHKFVGGGRVIDTLGPDDMDISWSGMFLSADAGYRADQLNEMRRAGELIELLFVDRYYLVVISEFEAQTKKSNHVPYRITCTVLSDMSQTLPVYAPGPLQQAVQDVTSAVEMVAASPAFFVGNAIFAKTTGAVTTVATTAAQTAAISASVSSGTGAVSSVNSAAQTQLAAYTVASQLTPGLLGVTSAIGATNAMASAALAAENAARGTAALAYAGRAQKNLAEA